MIRKILLKIVLIRLVITLSSVGALTLVKKLGWSKPGKPTTNKEGIVLFLSLIIDVVLIVFIIQF